MREILFRGKNKHGKWYYGYYTEGYYLDGTPVSWIEVVDRKKKDTECPTVIPDTVGQFTGLTDKNGKRIFEGDVVKDDSGVVYPVVFSLTGFYLKYAPPYSCGFHYDMLPLSNYWHAHGAIIEVIGNIHDNPELLGGGNDGK